MKKLFTILFLFIACISHAQTVSISSSAAPSNTICSGTNVTFTAHISGFTNPSYKWYANGTEIPGAISSTYSSTSLTNGVQVYVKVTEGTASDGAIVTDGLRFNLDAGKTASYPGTGTTWTDLSGNGNHGTLSGATLTVYSSDNGGCFVFNGSTSNVNLNKNATEIGIYDNSYTADAWVYPTDLSGDRGMFGDEVSANRQGLHLIFRNGSIHQGHYGSDANIGSVTTNSWWHIVFTFDKATGATKMYKNGVDQGNSGTIGSYIGTSNIHLGQAYGNSGYFQGKGAVYKMYNRVLSSAEVTTNYNALKNRFGATAVSSTPITITVNAGPAIPVITIIGDACVNKTTLSTPAGLTAYAWQKDNVAIPGANVRTYTPTIAGDYKVQVTSGSCSTTSSATTIYTCAKTPEGKMLPITASTTMVATSGEINSKYGVDERGLMLTKPSVPTGTNPVTSGLILYLDATQSGSYSGSGNIWSDLSTQNNAATLVGSPTFTSNPSSFSFDGNNHAITSNLISSSLSSATFIAWINPSQSQEKWTGIIMSRKGYASATANATGLVYFSGNQIGYIWNDIYSSYTWSSGLVVPTDRWSMVAITVTANSATAYLCNSDGISSAVNTLTHSAVSGLKFYIGIEPLKLDTPGAGNRIFKGKIATSMIYSTALNTDNITSIFNAQKASFGL